MQDVTKEKIKNVYINTTLSWNAIILQIHYAITVLTQTATKKVKRLLFFSCLDQLFDRENQKSDFLC